MMAYEGNSSACRAEQTGMPIAAALLGPAGVVPFVALSAALWLAPAERVGWLADALTAYGAVILSFLGAVHWGLVMRGAPGEQGRWLSLGVVPALVAWFTTMMPHALALSILVLAFGGALVLDLMAVGAGLAPTWYRRLRLPLSGAVMTCLALSAAAVGLSGS